MVRFMVCTTFCSLFILNTSAQAQTGASRPEPKDMDVIKSLGLDLQGVYAKFGLPLDLLAHRESKPEDDRVLCDYGTFMLCLGRNQKVVDTFFRTAWKGSIMGLKIGDSRETVEKVMGAPKETYSNKDNVVTGYGYPMKDLNVTVYPAFDPQTGKLSRVEVSPFYELGAAPNN